MWLPNAALRHSQFSIIVIVLALALGVISYLTMPRSEDPQFDLPITLVEAVYPGATPLDVETLVVDPIEQVVADLEDIKKIDTTIFNGGARIEVTFLYGTDPDEGYDDIRLALANIRNDLPQEAAFFIEKGSPTSVNILQFAVWSEPMDYKSVSVASEQLQKMLSRHPQVQKSERWGLPDQIVEVAVLPERLKQYGLSINQVSEALASRADNLTPGFVDASERRFNVNASGNYQNLEEVRNSIVFKGEHSPIKISDVAHVDYASDEPTYLAYFEGKPVVFVTVEQAAGGNIFELTDTLLAEVDQFKSSYQDQNIQVELIFNQSESVEQRVNGFFVNLAQGLVLVAVLSLLFLGARPSLLITVTVPLSFAIAIGLLDMSGFGLEQMSIVGLIIALGLLVDDAIVVTESVHRTAGQGLSTLEAAKEGASRVGMASAIGTFTTVFAFLPMLLLESSSGDFMRSMPVTVSLVLVVSLLLSLTLTPLMASKLMAKSAEPKWSLQRPINHFAMGTYSSLLHSTLKHKTPTMIVAILVMAGGMSLFPRVGLALFPKAEKPMVLVDVQAPPNTALHETNAITQDVADFVAQNKAVKSVALNIGNANPRIYYNEIPRRGQSNYAQILVLLEHYDADGVAELLTEWRQHFAQYSEAEITVKEFQQGPVTDPPITIRIVGNEIDDVQQVSRDLAHMLRTTEGVVNVRNSIGEPQVELDLNIQFDTLALTGVDVATFDQTLKTVLTGRDVGTLKDDKGDSYPVQVKGFSPSFSEIAQIDVASNEGNLIPLNQFVQPQLSNGHPEFFHYQKLRNSKVSGDVAAGHSVAALTAQAIAYLDNYAMPAGVHYEVGGEEESRSENFAGLSHIMLIAGLGIFALLVFQFRSIIQPVVIFASIPFAVAGAIAGLLLTGYSFSMMAFVGLISLFGIVVNNAIILVDTVNYNRRQNMPAEQAVVAASATRLTPITLTTLTTIVGLLPLTLFGGKLWAPLGWVIISGLSVSTISSLIVVPILAYLVIKGKAVKGSTV
ncbi:efflux RND transporter permease subunit [Neiella marina]|uniref:Efflux RND transporter permease subunit n=1 Tax=Neiella holothuriorum TaxID=2870530 RepID=A0ABS7EH91_9GAMM|nr:efflux RND transporter permease subunit [Neiella holothuriorum]MBW8191655.1 efflux RND transporter permease subunit [Neiella holothuriorum]